MSAGVVALRGVVLQQIREHVGRGEVVDGDDLGALVTEHLAEGQTADATEAVDSNLNCHVCLLSLDLPRAGCPPLKSEN